jgi:hypothetical protein
VTQAVQPVVAEPANAPIALSNRCTCGALWELPLDRHVPGVGIPHEIEADDERSRWHTLTRQERFRLLPLVHDLWFAATHWTGIRDRMRCPSCKAVGTWKMHGSLLERWIYKDLAVRRWLCKWCGYYIGPKGRVVAYPDRVSHAWALPEPPELRQLTPAESLEERLGKTWPWGG